MVFSMLDADIIGFSQNTLRQRFFKSETVVVFSSRKGRKVLRVV